MITDADVTKLKGTFVTKEDFADLKLEFGELRDAVTTFDAKLGHIIEQSGRILTHLGR